MTKLGLTEEQLETLQNGGSVEFVLPGFQRNGYNTTIEIELADFEELNQYRNAYELRDDI